MRAVLPEALHLDLLHEATFVELVGHAERIEAMADARGATSVVIDEVQKLPQILDEVHRLIERRGFRFALTTPKRGATSCTVERARTGTARLT